MSESSSKDLSALRTLEAYRTRQISDVWDHIPATPEQFCDDAEFLGGEVWPTVRQDFIDFYASKENEAVFCEAIGAGKSFLSSLIAAYEAHRILCLRNPQKTLGLSTGSRLAIINMGTRAAQAKEVVFGEIKARIDRCQWFKSNYKYRADIQSRIVFETKNIHIIPGNSSERFPLGYNIICAILDEAAFFTDTEGHDVAEEIYLGLQRRLESRISKRYRWKLVVISSPRYEGDFIERKMREADCFKRRRSLWDAKPWQYPEEKVEWMGYKIPKSLVSMADKNPAKFKRDFMAIPSTVLDPYFEDRKAIISAIDGALRWQENGTLPEDFKPKARGYAAHIDLAVSRDSCGVAIGHRDGNETVIDFVWRIVPSKGHQVNFGAVREAILTLRGRGFKFQKVSYDGYQSVDSIQILTAKGIDCEILSVDRNLEPYDTLKEAATQGRLRIPNFPKLIEELECLELIDGKKVDHPPTGSKDCADAVAGVCFWLRSTESSNPQSVLIPQRSGPSSVGFYEKGPY